MPCFSRRALTTSARRSVAKICAGSSRPERKIPRTMASPIVPHPSTVSVWFLASMAPGNIAHLQPGDPRSCASLVPRCATPEVADVAHPDVVVAIAGTRIALLFHHRHEGPTVPPGVPDPGARDRRVLV